jgi:hypothetical protein
LKQILIIIIAILAFSACRKDNLLDDQNAKLEFSSDTVFFDTVFTTIGSITERIKLYNRNDRSVEVERVWLKNGTASNFKMNVDGTQGRNVENVRIEANDSIFVFIEVTVDPNGGVTPLVIEDQLMTSLNGNEQSVDLIAWGQDAYFWPSFAFQFPGDSIALFTDKPNVFYGYSLVDSLTTLIIPEGAQIHFHSGSGLIVGTQASLKIRGSKDNPVVIQGDRLEDFFKDVPGQWDQIVFTQTSTNNEVNHSIIKNGSIGLSVGFTLDPTIETRPSVKIRNTQILNMSYIGLIGIDGSIDAENTVVANCGDHTVALVLGGEYNFKHCTFANYWDNNPRSKATLLLSNFSKSSDGTIFKRDLNAQFSNSILHGALESEFQRERESGVDFNYVFDHMIMKLDTESVENTDHFIGIIENPENALFENPTESDYSLRESSAAINAGKAIGVEFDLIGTFRDANPDLGAYEYLP